MHGQLCFQIADALGGRDQLGLLHRGQASLETAVDAVFTSGRATRTARELTLDYQRQAKT
jgi:hypothetical protein